MTNEKSLPDALTGWSVEADTSRYGAFRVLQLQSAQREATSHERAERLEAEAEALLEAAPRLFGAAAKALLWFARVRPACQKAGSGPPLRDLREALRDARPDPEPVRHICAGCGAIFHQGEPLQPIARFWQRVEAGDVVPSGQCPDCDGLCYLVPSADA